MKWLYLQKRLDTIHKELKGLYPRLRKGTISDYEKKKFEGLLTEGEILKDIEALKLERLSQNN